MSSPSLVGGIAIRASDLPGALVFAVAYALLVPVFVARLAIPRSRNLLLVQFLFFATERVVLFSLRAVAAAHPHTEGRGLTKYMQATFALGFITLAHIISTFARTVLVNSTQPVGAAPQGSDTSLTPPPSKRGETVLADAPRRRFWFRRWSECTGLTLFVPALATGIVATASLYPPDDTADNTRSEALRYVSTALGLALVLSVGGILLWARWAIPHVNKRGVHFLLALTALLIIPPVYRLAVLHNTTPDLAAPAARALNTSGAKAAFYVLHVLPEWVVVALAGACNVREICALGLVGERYQKWRDETPQERARREIKAREREKMRGAAEDGGRED
ncbi:hypothetical protein B0H15DRAFT_328601 [Mycena belliarum]|uniref:Proteophosphoglycan ppg4 n=1 Tax=Mycena belliarum TaxID=1033014 RepID=A0AAD6XTM7_9AGAR|nr:hypothetical protein B0H15DRAFT_328601 [Mycena belliae]